MNPQTGYQETNSDYGFNSKRKEEFLALAREIIFDHHEYPNVGDLCRVIGITVRTFDNHLNSDQKFAEDWRELDLHAEATCLSDMYASRKKNPMFMWGWMRAKFPEKYDPSRKIQLSFDISSIKKVFSDNNQIVDTNIVDGNER